MYEEFIPRFVGNENFYDLDIDPYEKNLIGNSNGWSRKSPALALTYQKIFMGKIVVMVTLKTNYHLHLNQVYSDPNACINNSHRHSMN